MRRFALAALAAFFTLTAHAEGINRSPRIAAPVQASEPEAPRWHQTGIYGVVLGGYDVAVLEADGLDLSNGKLMGGGAIGFNYRTGHYIVGVEGDWLFTDIKASTTLDGLSVTASNRHLASVRARGGIAMGPALLYGTVGPAWQQIKLSAEGLGSLTEWQQGWVGGGGIELELTKSLGVRLEALHYIFDKDGIETQQTTARAGVVFRLN